MPFVGGSVENLVCAQSAEMRLPLVVLRNARVSFESAWAAVYCMQHEHLTALWLLLELLGWCCTDSIAMLADRQLGLQSSYRPACTALQHPVASMPSNPVLILVQPCMSVRNPRFDKSVEQLASWLGAQIVAGTVVMEGGVYKKRGAAPVTRSEN